jgi:hypothetical protein
LVDADPLALQILDLSDARPLLGQDAVAGDEHGGEEIDLALTDQGVGRGGAVDVGGAVDEERDARRADDRDVLDVELVELQLLLDALDDLQAEVDRVALRRAVRPNEREGWRVGIVADRDDAALLDLLARAL